MSGPPLDAQNERHTGRHTQREEGTRTEMPVVMCVCLSVPVCENRVVKGGMSLNEVLTRRIQKRGCKCVCCKSIITKGQIDNGKDEKGEVV